MLTIGEFKVGINSLLPISIRILERLFGLMDHNSIGMVDVESFCKVINIKVPSQIPRKSTKVEDGFQWQQDTIKSIRLFVKREGLAPGDAFKFFDQDFDGKISKDDMR